MIKKTDIAHIAGILEGEGYVTISKYKNNNRYSYYYRLAVSIEMTDFEVINYINEVYPGNVGKYSPRKNGTKSTLKIIWTGNAACNFLELVLPYLKGRKVIEAKIGIQFHKFSQKVKVGKYHRISEELSSQRDYYYNLMRTLKHCGIEEQSSIEHNVNSGELREDNPEPSCRNTEGAETRDVASLVDDGIVRAAQECAELDRNDQATA